MSDILRVQVVQDTEKLLYDGPAGIFWKPPVVGLSLLRL